MVTKETAAGSLVNKSGYLRLNDFCMEYILTQCCLPYFHHICLKLSDLNQKLEGLRCLSLSLSFLDLDFYHEFLFCCVFFKPHELGLGGTL